MHFYAFFNHSYSSIFEIALRSLVNLHFGSDGASQEKERSTTSELTKSNFERSAHERYKEKRAQ